MNYYISFLEISGSLFLQYLLGTAVVPNIFQQHSDGYHKFAGIIMSVAAALPPLITQSVL
jgi:hypothetical protein